MAAHFFLRKFLLIIKDPKQRVMFTESRRKNINFLGIFILLVRFVNIMIRVLAYQEIEKCVQTHYYILCGPLLHILI